MISISNATVAIEHDKGIKLGSWDSIHAVTVTQDGPKFTYRVTSNVILKMESTNASYGDLDIAGNLSKTVREINRLFTNHNREKRPIQLQER